ncbi:MULTISPECIES: lipid-transfer protein [Rhodococcus]|uniref:lipid-transfer protein n=1 Tax=Rhodococcus TaxID=1827 RepID=UPI00295456A0|nr:MULTISPECIES: lipid-transfer protein [Rhodococcus]MDV7242703.1 lipid-transfer protein [Rhodococcus oxybenzonivorans]MDV7276136.1 lipid-transfer protein [Rhodococcus oxybenzonivorans]MDV7332191.1 lipid-transfer protein [Rhodococcus oxybenzonivorans]MDV7344396.1 lipid-transfer protein [Rhodococcus oxybenzonivorans]MDV8027079.1 lipid-transfer protein [Rhodococcus sp. IEGM 27]
MRNVCISGVGMMPFTKPGRSETYDRMGAAAAAAALKDAGLEYTDVQQAFVGYVYGDSTSGQNALYEIGMTGIPVVNVNNNCSTGSSALWLARQAVASGSAECVLALGFEQMQPGALVNAYGDRPSPTARGENVAASMPGGDENAPMAAKLFGGAGLEYMSRYGVSAELFGRVSVKARAHAAQNPLAVFRDPIDLPTVMSSKQIWGPLTLLMCCPPTNGAAAAIVCSEEFARAHGLDASVRIRAQSMVTDLTGTFDTTDMMRVAGYDMTAKAAAEVYEQSGVDPLDIPVVELHDCFSTNEVITYEGLGLTPEGTAEKFVLDGDNTYGGRVVTNPSGGLLSKGHPLGATGLAQCAELVWHLRGQAGDRQVEGARIALQHNLGLGGACVVTMYEKVD